LYAAALQFCSLHDIPVSFHLQDAESDKLCRWLGSGCKLMSCSEDDGIFINVDDVKKGKLDA
jgi:hypothetical protein